MKEPFSIKLIDFSIYRKVKKTQIFCLIIALSIWFPIFLLKYFSSEIIRRTIPLLMLTSILFLLLFILLSSTYFLAKEKGEAHFSNHSITINNKSYPLHEICFQVNTDEKNITIKNQKKIAFWGNYITTKEDGIYEFKPNQKFVAFSSQLKVRHYEKRTLATMRTMDLFHPIAQMLWATS